MRNKITLDGFYKEVFKISGDDAMRDFNRDGRILFINDTIIVVKFKGYRENPGSRYSGLMTYYPAETVVYGITERIENKVRCVCLGSWSTFKRSKS